jgi:hypothetical protein
MRAPRVRAAARHGPKARVRVPGIGAVVEAAVDVPVELDPV